MLVLIRFGDGQGGGTVTQMLIKVPCTDFRTEKMHSGTRLISHRLEALATELLCKVASLWNMLF